MREVISKTIGEDELKKRILELANQINADYEGKKIHLICVLKGAVFFACELAKNLSAPVSIDFMSMSSYGDGLTSQGVINLEQDLTIDIADRDVLLVEDIIDSGRTLFYLANMLKKRNPASLKLCTLLDKPIKREAQVELDYIGFEIDDYFAVGFGLDYAQKYRNLPYIGELKFET